MWPLFPGYHGVDVEDTQSAETEYSHQISGAKKIDV